MNNMQILRNNIITTRPLVLYALFLQQTMKTLFRVKIYISKRWRCIFKSDRQN